MWQPLENHDLVCYCHDNGWSLIFYLNQTKTPHVERAMGMGLDKIKGRDMAGTNTTKAWQSNTEKKRS